jgi:hypothetical protein
MLRTKSRHLTPAGSIYRVYQYDWDSVMGSSMPSQTVFLGSECFQRPTARSFQWLTNLVVPGCQKHLRILTELCRKCGAPFPPVWGLPHISLLPFELLATGARLGHLDQDPKHAPYNSLT